MVTDDDVVDSTSEHRSIPVSMVALTALDAVENAKENVTLGVDDIDQ